MNQQNQEWNNLLTAMDQWAREIDHLVNQTHHVSATQEHSEPFTSEAVTCSKPAVNVYENEEMVIVLVEIAGIGPGDVIISLESDQLIIKGQRRRVMPEDVQVFHRMEIWFGPFSLEVPLPEGISTAQAEASYHTGFLEVRLPKQTTGRLQNRIPTYIHLKGMTWS
ncbi:MAG: Hsp20/alpha crystallin family protein [Gloeobacterales cyanobacterium]